MKNDRGFTLIELLAIIVILSIIAFITVPKVLGLTASARKGAAKTSAMEYVEAFEKTAVEEFAEIDSFTSFDDGCYYVNDMRYINAHVKGEIPTDGWLRVYDGMVTEYSLIMDDEYVVTSFDIHSEPTVEEGFRTRYRCATEQLVQ